jgi:two-component system nitrogen regulation response regulator NtrX
MIRRPPGGRAVVLLVDDEPAIRDSLRMILEYESYVVEEARGGIEALARLADRVVDVVILDVKMPDMDGLEVLRQLRERGHEQPVVVVSGHGDFATAVEATKRGAFDYLEKPLQRDRVLLALRNALEADRLERENRALRLEGDQLVGASPAIRQLLATVDRAAPTPATVLITGESGTGKELVARLIHDRSARRDRAFVMVNCAAIPEELIESELFGHEKGSFTGAVRRQAGKFAVADGGTIFLDEIGDMSARTQAKVLRALQNGEVEPVGAERSLRVDVRVVAATNRNLEEEIKAGRFREDLFYRLAVVVLRTPPLRERADDIPLLVDYFVRRAVAQGYRARIFAPGALEHLSALPFRGNVRELKNLVERLLILCPRERVERDDVLLASGGAQPELGSALLGARSLREFQETSERLFILHKLAENNWNVTRTAEAIDTPRSNLYKKMEQYEIHRAGAAEKRPAGEDTAAGEAEVVHD